MTSIKTTMGSTMTKSRARSTEFMFIIVVIIKKGVHQISEHYCQIHHEIHDY